MWKMLLRMGRAIRDTWRLMPFRRQKESVAPSTIDQPTTHEIIDATYILLCFPYDAWTREVALWLEELADLPVAREREFDKLLSPDARRSDLRSLLDKYSERSSIEIFCGHGDYDALLGPPLGEASDIQIGDIFHGILYDSEMISNSPSQLFAFCCRSARTFGRVFATYRKNVFLGFDEDIPIVFDSEFLLCLKGIFTSVASDLLLDGGILPEHESKLRNGYKEAINYYLHGEGRRSKRSFLMKLYLEQHRGAVKRFGNSEVR